jgi:tripartite-type tricarboxylate transporter receptor subunit TctC
MIRNHNVYAALLMLLTSCGAHAQAYPNRPIRLVTAGVGSTTDIAARTIGFALSGPLGQQVIVENRATVVLTAEAVSNAPPDGYTLLVSGSSLWVVSLLEKVSFDPVNDFLPISMINIAPNILIVHPSVPAHNVRELIALAKSRPGALNYGTSGTGATPHLAAELFKSMANVNIVRISYKSIGQALTDLFGGQIQVMFPVGGGIAPHIKSGKVRALAVTGAQPSRLFPGVPTIAATGLPGYEIITVTSMYAPAKTPDAVINRLSQEMERVIKLRDIQDKFINAGVEPVSSTPAELGKFVRLELVKTSKLIKDSGIRAD